MKATPDIVVAVGTDHHPFPRLVDWADRWAADHPELVVLVQRGVTPAPEHAESVDLLGYDELMAAMDGARAIVAQGGPATIADARNRGRRPIVVPRHGSRGEHVDDHQVRFASWMAERDLVHLAEDEETFRALLDRSVTDPEAFAIAADHGHVAASVDAFARLVDPLLQTRRGRRP